MLSRVLVQIISISSLLLFAGLLGQVGCPSFTFLYSVPFWITSVILVLALTFSLLDSRGKL